MSFPIFNALSYTGMPPLPGLHPLHLGGTWDFFRYANGKHDKARGDEAMVRAWAGKANGNLSCINIEHWPLDVRKASDRDVEASIDLLSEIIDWIRDEAPGVRLGVYGIMPLRDYWTPVSGKGLAAWFGANARLRKSRDKRGRWIAEGLADKVDVVFPSIYAFYDDAPGWEKYAIANLKQSRDYGKQVYGFGWAHYHDSNKTLGGQLLPVDYCQRIRTVSEEYADGLVAWGGWKVPWSADVALRVGSLTGN